MKMNLLAPLSVALACAAGATFATPAAVGQPAPVFSTTDVDGKAVALTDFKGKTVVLEWVNPECPYVRKHYGSANMQATQKAATAKGVVWLAVNSTETRHVDYKPPAAMAARIAIPIIPALMMKRINPILMISASLQGKEITLKFKYLPSK